MVGKFAGFIGSVAAIPVIGQIPVQGTLEKLAQGTVQMVLAVVVIFLSLALVRIYQLHRNDMLASRQELKEDNKVIQGLLAENVKVMTSTTDSNTDLKEAIKDLSKVIQGCLHHNNR